MFPKLLRLAVVVGAKIARLFADAGYDSADNRWLCLREGIQPLIRKIGSEHGSGLGVVREDSAGCAALRPRPGELLLLRDVVDGGFVVVFGGKGSGLRAPSSPCMAESMRGQASASTANNMSRRDAFIMRVCRLFWLTDLYHSTLG